MVVMWFRIKIKEKNNGIQKNVRKFYRGRNYR